MPKYANTFQIPIWQQDVLEEMLGKFKHICELFSWEEVRDHSENSPFLVYLSMAFKNRSPQNYILKFNIPNPFNLFLQSLGFLSKILFVLYQEHFPHPPPGGRWIHSLERDPTPPYRKLSCKGNLSGHA